MNIEITYEQAKALLEAFGKDTDATIIVSIGDGTSHSGPGLYAHYEACAEEGSLFLGKS